MHADATVERDGLVESIGPTHVVVRLHAGCRGCGGCGGRCSLFAAAAGDRIELSLGSFATAPQAGQALRFSLRDDLLLRQAALGYGLPLLGLLGGALLLHVLAGWLNVGSDFTAAAGGLMGTLAGVEASKRAMPVPFRIDLGDAGGDVPSLRTNDEDPLT